MVFKSILEPRYSAVTRSPTSGTSVNKQGGSCLTSVSLDIRRQIVDFFDPPQQHQEEPSLSISELFSESSEPPFSYFPGNTELLAEFSNETRNLTVMQTMQPSDKNSFERLYEMMMSTKRAQGVQTVESLLLLASSSGGDTLRLKELSTEAVETLGNQFKQIMDRNTSTTLKVLNKPKILPKNPADPPVGAATCLCVFISLVSETLVSGIASSGDSTSASHVSIPDSQVKEMRKSCYAVAKSINKLRRTRVKTLSKLNRLIIKFVNKTLPDTDSILQSNEMEADHLSRIHNSASDLTLVTTGQSEPIGARRLSSILREDVNDRMIRLGDREDLSETEMELRLECKNSENKITCRMFNNHTQLLSQLDYSIQIKILLSLMQLAHKKFKSSIKALSLAILDFRDGQQILKEMRRIVDNSNKFPSSVLRRSMLEVRASVAHVIKVLKKIEESTRLSRFFIADAAQYLKLAFGQPRQIHLKDFDYKPKYTSLYIVISCGFLIPRGDEDSAETGLTTIMRSMSISTFEFTSSELEIKLEDRQEKPTLVSEPTSTPSQLTHYIDPASGQQRRMFSSIASKFLKVKEISGWKQLADQFEINVLACVQRAFARIHMPNVAENPDSHQVPYILGMASIASRMLTQIRPFDQISASHQAEICNNFRQLSWAATLRTKKSQKDPARSLTIELQKMKETFAKIAEVSYYNESDGDAPDPLLDNSPLEEPNWEFTWSSRDSTIVLKPIRSQTESSKFSSLSLRLKADLLISVLQCMRFRLSKTTEDLAQSRDHAKKLQRFIKTAVSQSWKSVHHTATPPGLELYDDELILLLNLHSQCMHLLKQISAGTSDLAGILSVCNKHLLLQQYYESHKNKLEIQKPSALSPRQRKQFADAETHILSLYHCPLTVKASLKFKISDNPIQLYNFVTTCSFLSFFILGPKNMVM